MSPPLKLFHSAQTIACRSRFSIRNSIPPLVYFRLTPVRNVSATEKPLPKASEPGPGPNQEQLPHVSEEAAATGKITGDGGPDIDQGTPVQEVGRALHM